MQTCPGHSKILPLVLNTGHQQCEQVEREEDTQTEQHAPHIHLRCGQRKENSFTPAQVPTKYRHLTMGRNCTDTISLMASLAEQRQSNMVRSSVCQQGNLHLMAGETNTSRTLVRLPDLISSSGRRG